MGTAGGHIRRGCTIWATRSTPTCNPTAAWGWSNAGLIVDGDEALLIDTLFDLRLTGEMLDTMRRQVPAARNIGTVVNTHANGDHCWGNELVAGATIIASRRTAEEMALLPRRRWPPWWRKGRSWALWARMSAAFSAPLSSATLL